MDEHIMVDDQKDDFALLFSCRILGCVRCICCRFSTFSFFAYIS